MASDRREIELGIAACAATGEDIVQLLGEAMAPLVARVDDIHGQLQSLQRSMVRLRESVPSRWTSEEDAVLSGKGVAPGAAPTPADVNRALLEGSLMLTESGLPQVRPPAWPVFTPEGEASPLPSFPPLAETREQAEWRDAARFETQRRLVEPARLRPLTGAEVSGVTEARSAARQRADLDTEFYEAWYALGDANDRRRQWWLDPETQTMRRGRHKGQQFRGCGDVGYFRWIMTTADIHPSEAECRLFTLRVKELSM